MSINRTEENLRAVASGLDKIFNPGGTAEHKPVGFVLLTFDMGEAKAGEGRCNYVSNGANREDIAVMFKEIMGRWEGQPEMKGHG